MSAKSVVAVEAKRRMCLIVAPRAANLGVIRRLLRDKGVEPLALSDVPPLGVTVLDQLDEALARADLVVFVLTSPRVDADVYFEIGLAHGRGKRLMVLAPDGVGDAPAGIRELSVVRAGLDDDEAIDFSLDQFLAAPQPNGRRAAVAPAGGATLGDAADLLIRRAESLKTRSAREPATPPPGDASRLHATGGMPQRRVARSVRRSSSVARRHTVCERPDPRPPAVASARGDDGEAVEIARGDGDRVHARRQGDRDRPRAS